MTRSARLAVGASLSILLALPGNALAAGISVTTTDDEILGTGCSLREAISAANGDFAGPGGDCTPGSGPDVITLGASGYVLDETNLTLAGENSNATGDLDIFSDVTIEGQGVNQTTISANSIDRVLHLLGTPTVELRDLKITGGAAPSGDVGTPGANTATNVPSVGGFGESGSSGGGIIVQGGDLTLTSVEVTNNSAGSGGDGGIGGTAGNGSGGTPGANSTGGGGGFGASGGGVALVTGTELHATDTVFNQNSAGDGGAGGTGGTGGTGSTNTTGANGGSALGGQGGFGGDGGAISADGAIVELTRVTMTANEAGVSGNGGNGGTGGAGGVGISFAGGNGGASNSGSAVFGGFGGAISQMNNSSLTITDSVLAGNKAGRAGDGGTPGTPGAAGTGNTGPGVAGNSVGGNGGGGGGNATISSIGGVVNLIGSTFSGNTSAAGGDGGDGGPVGSGGVSSGGNGGEGGYTAGISQGSGALNLTNSTVSGNTTEAAGDGGAGSGTGSVGGNGGSGGSQVGVFAGAGVTGALVHVTIAGNQAGAPGFGGTASTPGFAGSPGTVGGFHSDGNNVILRNSIIASNTANQCGGAGFTDGGHNLSFPSDISCPATLHSNPLLDALASNGGPTQTMALGVGSPAIDAVPATGSNCEAIDQRDIDRPRGPACDIGAFESARPLVTTGAFSAVTTTSAGVAGTVNPNQRSTTYRFAFGKTTAYGSLTPSVAAAPGDSAVAVSVALTGLTPGTLYHYRVVATNGDGTVAGADKTFTTKPAPSGQPGQPIFRGVSILTKSARADRKGRVSVKLRCPTSAVVRCKGTLSLTAKVKIRRKGQKPKTKTIKLGSASFSIDTGKTKTVRIKLSKSKRRLLARSKRLKGALTARATDNRGGTAKTTEGKLSVKAPKRKRR